MIKAYTETIVKARLHLVHFRPQTLAAYRERCCVCELRERPLLDAAHIVPDRLPEGAPTIRNGRPMCATHHRAYDQEILLVTENYRVEVRGDGLVRGDSDATRRTLRDFHGRSLWLLREEGLRPDAELLRKKIELAA
ncbi:HNH endonuclease [Sorangium sp. So ce394]|uniref:HNH endonuclease n=1 Tax=Sorangium sp. So ce394 TaxID=3133310 RepID=UPI003F5B9B01